MKTALFALVAATITAPSAFALSPRQINAVVTDAQVLSVLGDRPIKSLEQGISYRCLGCFGVKLSVYNMGGEESYDIHGVELRDGKISIRQINRAE